jgi:hypothetical protein
MARGDSGKYLHAFSFTQSGSKLRIDSIRGKWVCPAGNSRSNLCRRVDSVTHLGILNDEQLERIEPQFRNLAAVGNIVTLAGGAVVIAAGTLLLGSIFGILWFTGGGVAMTRTAITPGAHNPNYNFKRADVEDCMVRSATRKGEASLIRIEDRAEFDSIEAMIKDLIKDMR